ncbi:MAG: hypothetical protein Q4E75_02225 [bacterium]|nr:hypothetical protein [bacterium]
MEKNWQKDSKELEAYLTKKIGKSKDRKQSSNKKGFVALLVAFLIGCGSIIGLTGCSNKKNNKNKTNNETTEDVIDTLTSEEIEDVSLDDLGVELPFETQKSQIISSSKNIAPNKVVVGKDGTIWVDSEALNNSSKVGTSTVDTKGGTITVDNKGTARVNKEGYEVYDESGNLIEKGVGDNPTIKSDDKSGTVVAEATYYDESGNVVIEKGDRVLENTYKEIQSKYFTKKPVVEDTQAPKEDGIVNSNGTYTISGMTFESKSSYQNWINQGCTGYGIDTDGIMKPISKIENNSNEKVETTSDKKNTSDEKVKNSNEKESLNGTYKVSGMTFKSKADYEQWVINGYKGYAEVGGIMVPDVGEYSYEEPVKSR